EDGIPECQSRWGRDTPELPSGSIRREPGGHPGEFSPLHPGTPHSPNGLPPGLGRRNPYGTGHGEGSRSKASLVRFIGQLWDLALSPPKGEDHQTALHLCGNELRPNGQGRGNPVVTIHDIPTALVIP